MVKIEQDVIINRTAKEVFTFLSLAENHAHFIPGMRQVVPTLPGSFAQVGATARGVRRDAMVNSNVHYEVTQVEVDRRLGMKGRMGPIRFSDGYVLEALADSTRVHFWLQLGLNGPLRIVNPIVRLIGKTHARETLTNLKEVLEPASMPVDPYQPFRNPVTRETFRCISSTEETYTMEWIMEPGGYIPFEHIHVAQDEVCHVQHGTVRAIIDGAVHIGTAGQTLTIPRGTRHIAFNDTSDSVSCTIEYSPGLDVFKSFQCFGGLTLDNDFGRRYGINVPKMMYFMKHLDIKALVRPAFVPNPLFRLGLIVSLAVGKVLRWDKQCRTYTGG